jgi:hypothetical protein
MALGPNELKNNPNDPVLRGYARQEDTDGEQHVVAVVTYHGLTKCLTESDLLGGIDAAMAQAQVELQKEEQRIQQEREAERRMMQNMVGFFSGALSGMHEAMADPASFNGLPLIKTATDFLGLTQNDTHDPAAPKPTDDFLAQMRQTMKLGMMA